MSMTSAVNKTFADAIVNFAKLRGTAVTNLDIYLGVFSYRTESGQLPSMRSIQEATQKLTKAGILASPQRGKYVLAYTTGGTSATAATV